MKIIKNLLILIPLVSLILLSFLPVAAGPVPIDPFRPVYNPVTETYEGGHGASPRANTPNPNTTSTVFCSFRSDSATVASLFNFATCLIVKSVIPLIFALAVAMFVWGVVQYVINGDDEAKKTKGREFMIWGIIALTVMVSVWGLVRILATTFGIENVIPQLQTQTR